MKGQLVKIQDVELGGDVEILMDKNNLYIRVGYVWDHTLPTRVVGIDSRDNMRMVGWETEPPLITSLLMRRDIVVVGVPTLVKVPDFDRYQHFLWAGKDMNVLTQAPKFLGMDMGTSALAVNDHVCPTCKNTRCSKTEKTCWRCGGIL